MAMPRVRDRIESRKIHVYVTRYWGIPPYPTVIWPIPQLFGQSMWVVVWTCTAWLEI